MLGFDPIMRSAALRADDSAGLTTWVSNLASKARRPSWIGRKRSYDERYALRRDVRSTRATLFEPLGIAGVHWVGGYRCRRAIALATARQSRTTVKRGTGRLCTSAAV